MGEIILGRQNFGNILKLIDDFDAQMFQLLLEHHEYAFEYLIDIHQLTFITQSRKLMLYFKNICNAETCFHQKGNVFCETGFEGIDGDGELFDETE